jgi:hypothetical protein
VGVIVTILAKWIADSLQRRFEFRRQLYLDMVDAMQAVTHCIARLGDPNTSLSETVQKYQATSGPIAKVELAAPKSLSKALTAFNQASSSAYLQMMAMRFPIEQGSQQLIVLDEQLIIFRRQQEQLLDEIRRLSIDGNQDKERTERVNRYYDSCTINIQKVHDTKELIVKAMTARTNQMGPIAIEWMKQFSNMMPSILMLARKGLGFWFFDLRDYQNRAQEDVRRIAESSAQMRDWMNQVSEQIDKKMKSKKVELIAHWKTKVSLRKFRLKEHIA